jgi:Organic Anion Transporter Polypeptide (OATP) family
MACLVWGHTCGKTGNCWLYDVEKLRYYVNLPIVGEQKSSSGFDHV